MCANSFVIILFTSCIILAESRIDSQGLSSARRRHQPFLDRLFISIGLILSIPAACLLAIHSSDVSCDYLNVSLYGIQISNLHKSISSSSHN